MKYIKKYELLENIVTVKYWYVQNKYPDILIIFDKLKIPKDWGRWLWSEDNHLLRNYFIFKTKYTNGNIGWSYSPNLTAINTDEKHTFMGKIKITEKDREKFYLKRDSEKYNL